MIQLFIVIFLLLFVVNYLFINKVLYATIYYKNGDKEEYGPFESERDFFYWIEDHNKIYNIKSYTLEYRKGNINHNLT